MLAKNMSKVRDFLADGPSELVRKNGVVILLSENSLDQVDQLQKEFYESCNYEDEESVENPVKETRTNRLWRNLRSHHAKGGQKRQDRLFYQHLSAKIESDKDKKINILEIGANAGTPGTEACIKHADAINYVTVELALNPLFELQRRLEKRGVTDFHLICDDILSSNLKPESFDFIFGRGILHHFSSEKKEKLASKISSLLTEGGQAVFIEPLNTNIVLRFLRYLSSALRPNLTWEHPFSGQEVRDFVKYFGQQSKVDYIDFLRTFSMLFTFIPPVHSAINDALIKVDNFAARIPFLVPFFTKGVFVLSK